MQSVLNTITSIPAPEKSLTLIEEILAGDVCDTNEVGQAQVEYVCEEDNSLLEVDEYTSFKYRVVIGTPILCPIKYDFLPPVGNVNFSMDKVIYMRRRRYKSKG